MLLRYLLITFLFVMCFETPVLADEGAVDITPRRVVLNPRDRSGEFTLLNSGTTESTIRVQIINYTQDERGIYTEIKGPLNPLFDPEKIIRLSPRQFTIPPGGRQKVRFSIRKPADLPDGEYRFHVMASRMANYGPPAPVDPGEKKIGVKLNISVAIPVSVRQGNVEAGATVSDLQFVEKVKAIGQL